MPSTGGEPRQLTFYPARGPLTPRWGYDNQVYGWTADGTRVLFRSHRDGVGRCRSRGCTRSPATGGPAEPLPMPESGAGDLSPDGKRVVYSPRSRDFRSEKRYGGGQANDLFIFDLARPRRHADHRSPARRARPDVDRRHDLLQLRPRRARSTSTPTTSRAKTTTPVTSSTTWDVRWPSAATPGGASSTSSNGELQMLDTKTGKAAPIADHGARRRPGAPARAASPVGTQIARRRAEPEGRARAVRGARRHLHRADREGADAQPDAARRARTTSGRGGRRTAGASPSSPTRRARRSSASSRRTAPASRSS